MEHGLSLTITAKRFRSKIIRRLNTELLYGIVWALVDEPPELIILEIQVSGLAPGYGRYATK